MLKQMSYIVNERSLTEDRIINGMALLKSNVNLFNNMLEYSSTIKKKFFDLYFKVKAKTPGRVQLPVTNNELRMFRTIDEIEMKSLPQEVQSIGETVLFTETLHRFKKPETKKQ